MQKKLWCSQGVSEITMFAILAHNESIDTASWEITSGEAHFWPEGPPPARPRWELVHLPSRTVYRFATIDLVAAALRRMNLPFPYPDTAAELYALKAGRVPQRYQEALKLIWVRRLPTA